MPVSKDHATMQLPLELSSTAKNRSICLPENAYYRSLPYRGAFEALAALGTGAQRGYFHFLLGFYGLSDIAGA